MLNLLLVNVPVLSIHKDVTLPKVSHALRFLTITPFCLSLYTEYIKLSVKVSGRDSGIQTSIKVTA